VTKTYTRQEADEILRRALAAQPATEGISHDDLVAAAREVGIPTSAIEAAAGELTADQHLSERADHIRRRRRTAFLRHLLIFLVVNGGVFFVDHADGGAYWFQYLLVIWGVILAVIGIAQLAPDRKSLLRRAERELEKERRRALRRSQRAARKEGVKEFEAAVQEGVSSLLSVAARKIRDFSADGGRYRVREERVREQDAEIGAKSAATGPAAARSRRHRD
jgi:hypothetical protein